MIDTLVELFDLITEKYGQDEYQEGDLYLPKGNVAGTLCLFHGGFWKMPYDRSEMSPVAMRFARLGFVVWNVEYRRTGTGRGGYPETFDDAVDSVNWESDPMRIEKSTGRHLLWKCCRQFLSS